MVRVEELACGELRGTNSGYARHYRAKQKVCPDCWQAQADYRKGLPTRPPPPAFLLEDTDWMLSAACKGLDSDLFFPPPGVSSDEAKEICAGCGVRKDCLDYALKFESITVGIWGGLTGKERRRLRRRTRATI